MRLVEAVLKSKHFDGSPPVIVDVGGAGGSPGLLRRIAPYSHCIVFDADDRDFSGDFRSSKEWRRLSPIRRVVTAERVTEVDFFLTSSPHCSSTLRPYTDGLKPWDFRGLFEVVDELRLPAVTLSEALESLDVPYVDWFKFDSQGTDLRLWASLPSQVADEVSVVSFEPGILSSYEGEDKLYEVMRFMDSDDWFLGKMELRGARRLSHEQLAAVPAAWRRVAAAGQAVAPGWGELWYLRNYAGDSPITRRGLLFAWVASTLLKQHGHAWAVAAMGDRRFGDSVFQDCLTSSQRALMIPSAQTARRVWESVRARAKGGLDR